MTYETFRDMGLAFAVALIVIYILVVWEFGNFVVPAIIMAPIPLTMLGIIPGHMLLGAEFTATSMIGFIALAGIIVRNSILLVDYAIHQVKDGKTNAQAVVEACRARTRPIIITAFALVAGSSVILSDPIFQGMAISLLFGVIIASVLTLIVIPLGCITAGSHLCPDCDLLPPDGGDEPGGDGDPWGSTAWARASAASESSIASLRALSVMAYAASVSIAKKSVKVSQQWQHKISAQAKKIQTEARVKSGALSKKKVTPASKKSATRKSASNQSGKPRQAPKASKPAASKAVIEPQPNAKKKAPASTVKKRVARKKQAQVNKAPPARKRPAVKAKSEVAKSSKAKAAPGNKKPASKNANGKSSVGIKVSAVASLPKANVRQRGNRRGIRLNPNI